MILPVASDVKISWNGATRETAERVMIGSRFDKQLVNLKEFLKIRDHVASTLGNRASGIFCFVFSFFWCEVNIDNKLVTLQLTFMEVNLNEIPEVVKLAIPIGVDRIKGVNNCEFKKTKNNST
jgi:hypothetical protein